MASYSEYGLLEYRLPPCFHGYPYNFTVVVVKSGGEGRWGGVGMYRFPQTEAFVGGDILNQACSLRFCYISLRFFPRGGWRSRTTTGGRTPARVFQDVQQSPVPLQVVQRPPHLKACRRFPFCVDVGGRSVVGSCRGVG